MRLGLAAGLRGVWGTCQSSTAPACGELRYLRNVLCNFKPETGGIAGTPQDPAPSLFRHPSPALCLQQYSEQRWKLFWVAISRPCPTFPRLHTSSHNSLHQLQALPCPPPDTRRSVRHL